MSAVHKLHVVDPEDQARADLYDFLGLLLARRFLWLVAVVGELGLRRRGDFPAYRLSKALRRRRGS